MSKYRVMVVDDDPDIRFVIKGLLGDDFEMVAAESGLDALEKVERYEPDLILLDISMPIMNGFATLRAIRKNEDFRETPVYFLTGASSEENREKAREAGCEGFVEKPFDTGELVDEIRGFFTRHRQPPALKTFTMRELRRIDETPLHAGDGSDASEPTTATAPAAAQEAPPEEKKPAKKRRVFGAAKATPPPEPEPAPEPEAAPPPPLPPPEPAKPKPPQAPAPPPPRREEAPPPPRPQAPVPPTAPAPEMPAAAAAKKSPPRIRPRRDIPAHLRQGAGGSPGKRPRVLCLIAEPTDMNAYGEGLKGLAEFLPLQDPVEAVEIIARFQPDVVVGRVQDADFNGLQLAQMLRANPRMAHTELIFVTTGAETPPQQRAIASFSRNTTLRRPVQADNVRKALQALTQRPDFSVREKKLGYGKYVSEVLSVEREQQEALRAQKEKQFQRERRTALSAFIEELNRADENQPAGEES